jgi:hypothetical protein
MAPQALICPVRFLKPAAISMFTASYSMKSLFSHCGWMTAALIGSLGAVAHAAVEPTIFEQYQLELINRARANPNAEVTRLSGQTWGDTGNPQPASLNEGLPAGSISGSLKQPLAFNLDLIQAARDYANLLLANNAFTHTFGGTDPGSRAQAAGYPSDFVGENLAVDASSGPLVINQATAEGLHNQLFIDSDVAGRGHRVNLMDPTWREVGLGIGQSTTYTYLGAGFPNAVLGAESFANANGPFLTGVVFNDNVTLDNFYTPGEGLGGITINLYLPATLTLAGSTTTYGSGGYRLPVAPGAYDVQFVNGLGQIYSTTVNWSGTENFKLDAVSPVFVPEPGSCVLLALGAPLFARRRQSGRQQ